MDKQTGAACTPRRCWATPTSPGSCARLLGANLWLPPAPHRDSTSCPQRRCAALVCQAAKRVRLIKRREKLPARQRMRDKYQDVARPVPAKPGSQEYSGRLLTAINSANGPVQLQSIVSQHGDFMDGPVIAAVLGRLAGFALMDNLRPKQVSATQHCASACVRVLREKGVKDMSPLDTSRVAYSLYKLNRYDKDVFTALSDHSFDYMSSYQADALSGLGAGIGGAGHVPPTQWLERYQIETYIRLPRFTAQDISNVLFAFAKTRHTPSAVWLEAAQRRLRDVIPVSGVNPPALVRVGWALATLQVRPSFNWILYYLGEVRQRIDMLTAGELATAAWVCARWRHTPDPLFTEAWYQCVARRLPTCPTPALLLALQSAAQWGLEDAPPGKLLMPLLRHTKGLLSDLPVRDSVVLLWSLVSLRVRPDEEWMETFSAVCEERMSELGPTSLTNVLWSFARLRYQPSEEWENAAAEQISSRLAAFTPSQLALVIWGWRSVELSVPPVWEQVFRAASERVYPATQLQEINKLLGVQPLPPPSAAKQRKTKATKQPV